MKPSVCGILVVALIALVGTAQGWNAFSSVVTRLAGYQTPNGGFRGTDGKASLEATSNALLLTSLYHLQNKINTTQAGSFIKSCENTDGGYGPAPGSPSDLESTRNALQSLQHLGGKPTNPTNVLNYIKSLQDKSNNLFAVRSGEKGTVKGTALALQSVEALGELNQKWVQDSLPKIKSVLDKHRPTGEVFYFNFPEEKESSQLSANYYGIIAGSYAGFDFGAPAKWAKYITGQQSPAGQFYDTLEKKATSVGSTAHALLSLNALNTLKGVEKGAERFVDAVNVDNLKQGLRNIASDISSAAHAHSALALTDAFRDFFHTVVHHDGSDASNDYVVEGSNYKPSLEISSIFDDDTRHPHGGFDVSSSTAFHGKEATKGKLTWDQELHRYVSDHLPTVGNFGPVKTAFNLVHKVAGLGDLSFSLDDLKNIGYGMTVVPKVSQEGGRDIKEGESVSVGTDFKFTVSLNTRTTENMLNGDFTVIFSVLDSSNVIIHQDKLSGANNKAPIVFNYKFTNAAIPSGQLSFRFEVAGTGAPHTSRTLKYQYSVPLVASNIVFEGVSKGAIKLGEKAKVTIEPAAFPDLRNVYPLSSKDATGADASDSRKFVMDIKSPQGVLINSFPSSTTRGSSKYSFDFEVEPTLESIGTNVLSFRYIPAVGEEEVQLQNYDSGVGELYEDTQVLNFTVKADLQIVDSSSAPKAGDHYYGGSFGYKFRVKDNVSGKNVYVGPKQLANIYLNLQHEEGGRLFTSLRHPATLVGEGLNKLYNIDWTISPNAFNGSGDLSLSVVDVDGNAIPLKESKSLKVNVGGNIEVDPHTYATSIHTARHTAIIAEFVLSCRNRTLKDADLLVNVVRPGEHGGDEVVATVPVAHHNGRYTVSWTAPHKQIPSATYKLLFYRNVDRTRATERKEQREKRERKERELRGDTTVSPSGTMTAEDLGVKPLFVVEVPYSAPRIVSLPVRAEFLALVSLAGFLGWLTYKKNNLK